MAWIRLDDNAPHHRKVLAAGDVGAWLWVCGLAYCQRHATDGLIPVEAVPFLGCRGWKVGAAKLVAAGLWVLDPAGYRVHDFLQWNDSAELRRQRTRDGNDRVTRFRERQKQDGNAVGNATPIPTPKPIPIPKGEERSRAPVGGLITPPKNWGLNHGTHVTGFCDWMCLLAEDFGRFANRLGGDDKALAWAHSVRASGVVPTKKPWEFWNEQFDAAHGSATSAGGFSKADWDAHAPGGAIDKKLGLA